MKTISEALETSGFETIDFIILIIYICLLIVLGLFLSRNKDGKEKRPMIIFSPETLLPGGQ